MFVLLYLSVSTSFLKGNTGTLPCSLPELRCESQRPHCPLLGCQWSLQLLQVDLVHRRVLTIHLPPPLLLNVNNDNTRTEMREDHMSGQIQGLWRGFHSSISLDNLFTIPIITDPLGVGVCINIDSFQILQISWEWVHSGEYCRSSYRARKSTTGGQREEGWGRGSASES